MDARQVISPRSAFSLEIFSLGHYAKGHGENYVCINTFQQDNEKINALVSESDEFNMTSQDNVDLFPTFSISEEVNNFDSGDMDKVSDEHLEQQLSDSSETIQGNEGE